MVKQHLKRLFAPRTWVIKRKSNTYMTRPYPSGHSMENTLSLNAVLRDQLKLVKTRKEVRSVLNNNEVIVNGKRRKDEKTAMGLFDVISIKSIDKHYRIALDNLGRLTAVEVDAKEALIVPCKVNNKTSLKGGKLQLNCVNGINILTTEKKYNTGDVLFYDYTNKKITEAVSLTKGENVIIVGGKHRGKKCVVDEIKDGNLVFTFDNNKYVTKQEYGFALGKSNKITC